MTTDANSILDTLQELTDCRQRLDTLREGNGDHGLHRGVYRAYDNLTIAETVAGSCLVAYMEGN